VSVAVALAAAAGVCAAAAIAELAAVPRRAHGPSGHLAGMTVLLARLARGAGARAAPRDLHARIAAAGAPLDLTVADVMALKAAGAVAGLLLALPLATALPGRLGIALALCAPAGGFRAPDVALARRARARAARAAGELADVLDLLRVAVEAGLPAGRALAEVGRGFAGEGLLAAELGAAAARMELGATRAEALAELVERCPLDGVATLVAAIARSDRHGAPLAPALHALAAEARAEQARRVRDGAARAAPKIQLVVALVLVPAVMLLVAAVLVQTLVPQA
jgi:tight adherence protein C